MKNHYLLSILLVTSFVTLAKDKPKLVLQITVDQMRGDFINRYQGNLSKGGFNYLVKNGAVFSQAHHMHANTETIIGHTTLATGAHPSVHGMVANLWYDQKLNRLQYNVEDPNFPLLSKGAGVNKSTEIDPTQAAANSDGRSPNAILTTTLSDEIAISSNKQAKVFGISVKDRGAIAMAGHSGKAFWFSKKNGEFITSQYYYSKYPQWVEQFNNKNSAAKYGNQQWSLLKNQSSYLFAKDDEQAWEQDIAGFGTTFPHPYGDNSSPYFNTLLTLSPAGDELTLQFAKALIKQEKLGKDNITDYLSISFSSTDYVGHIFGPNSLESEDNFLRLDKKIAELIAYVDDQVGIENTLIVLSADHGAANTPGYLNKIGVKASYVSPEAWNIEEKITALEKKWRLKGKLLEQFVSPYVYLNDSVLASHKNKDEIISEVVAMFASFDGVLHAIPATHIENGQLPDTMTMKRITNNHHNDRSGDIYLVYEVNHFINDFDGLHVASTHGSPWHYDTYVPLIFAGWEIETGEHSTSVATADIAVTLADLLGINAPSGASGKSLKHFLLDD
ncbi:alkaline phosphatase family protein [Thalassotalea agarivorans]|uniref:Type I phosphodiesterase / nucleotide pyrophosphatase n=1 Tax=Thalassotalea agarivorans TaxID=349064 RepID=A0A1H9Y3U9_THASX|nr:alkaline phosphatase family protein [Thalassotalea agarivorans]SES63523.1 Type I phosphodiesterase / nucleotide pyrophosphatase [Thalassotalea agarivorans]